jgi:hypothetical protein
VDTEAKLTICPVCGFALGYLPWDGGSPSDEICPSCGIQFGYDDANPDGPAGRPAIYAEWRQRWIDGGTPWRSVGQPRPADWNPAEQVKRLG